MIPAIWLSLVAVAVDTGAASGGTPRRACGADSAYRPVPVYIRPTVAVRADTAAGSSLLLIAESVATRIRAALGAAPEAVPAGDSLLAATAAAVRRDSTLPGTPPGAWFPVDSMGVRVVARRNGTFRWEPIRSPASPMTELVVRALGEAQHADEVFIVGEQFTGDSIAFTLNYVRAFEVVGGRVRPVALGPATMIAFTLRTAVEKQTASVPHSIQAHYPVEARNGNADAVVRLAFVVDTTGLAIPSTVHDLWPADRPRLTGSLARYYQLFVDASVDAVKRARFYPAEIAGCKVKQRVELPMTFHLAR